MRSRWEDSSSTAMDDEAWSVPKRAFVRALVLARSDESAGGIVVAGSTGRGESPPAWRSLNLGAIRIERGAAPEIFEAA